MSGCVVGAIVAAALALSACGGPPPIPKDPFAYDASEPLRVKVAASADRGTDRVQSLTYTTADGSRVPALFAVPRRSRAVGCLIYQPGVGTSKEAAAPLWPLVARLGLAAFTIDPRFTGARAGGPGALQAAFSSPEGIVSFLRQDVVDLRRGLDYLEGQPACRHNVGYLGVSEGAELGVLLAGEDSRIRAAVLCSIGASWRSRLFYSPFAPPGITGDPGRLKTALAELAPFEQTHWIARIAPRPVMIVDGLKDPNVPPVDALSLIAAAGNPRVLVLHRGGHNPFGSPDGRAVAARVLGFLRQTLVQKGAPASISSVV